MTADAIGAALAALSPNDLRRLKAQIEMLLAGDEVKAAGGNIEFFWDALCTTYKDETGGKLPPLVIVRRGNSHVNAAFEVVEAFVTDNFAVKDRRDRIAAYRVLIRAVFEYAKARRCPLNLKSIVQQTANVAAAVHSQFPGYAQAKLLHLVLR